MNCDGLKYGAAEGTDVEQLRGTVMLSDDAAGLHVRRLARKYRLAPDADLIARLDDKMLCARYISKRGMSVDRFAELLSDVVTFGRPEPDRVIELLALYLPARRMTRAERIAQAAEQLETRNVARDLVQRQQTALIEFNNATKRGTKLMPWICDCTNGASAWMSFGQTLDATCNRCESPYRRKREIPTIDEAAAVASTHNSEDDEAVPF